MGDLERTRFGREPAPQQAPSVSLDAGLHRRPGAVEQIQPVVVPSGGDPLRRFGGEHASGEGPQLSARSDLFAVDPDGRVRRYRHQSEIVAGGHIELDLVL